MYEASAGGRNMIKEEAKLTIRLSQSTISTDCESKSISKLMVSSV